MVEKKAPLDRTTPSLGVRMENAQIVIPRVSDALVEPLLAKLAFDWLFFPYLQHLPDPAWQVSFLAPVYFLFNITSQMLSPLLLLFVQ